MVAVASLVAQVSTQGAQQAQSELSSVGNAATTVNEKFAGVKPLDMGQSISNVDIARAKLTLIESDVTAAREKLQTLRGAADAGEAVTGIEQANAQLTLLEGKAQEARENLQQLSSASNETGESFGSRLTGGVKSAVSGFFDFLSGAGQTLWNLQMIGQTAISTASALLQPAISAETMKTSFTTLLGSTKAATDEMSSLDAFASKTPFATMDIDKAAAQLIGFGTNAKDVVPELTSMGDALSAVGRGSSANLDSIVNIFGKIQLSGKLTGDAMMQFSDDGINAWGVLEKQTGKTQAQLQQMISAGLFPAKDAIEDLTKGIEANPLYAGGMAKQSATFAGTLSTLKSNFDQFLASVGAPILAQLTPLFTQLASTLASPAFKAFATDVAEKIIGSIQSLGDTVGKVFGSISHYLGLFDLAGITYAWGQLTSAVKDAVSPLGSAGDAFKSMSPFLTTLKNDFSQLLDAGIRDLAGIITNIADSIKTLTGFFKDNSIQAQIIKDLLIGIGVAFATIQIGLFIATIPALIAGFIGWAVAAGAAAIATIAATWPILAIGAAIALVVAGIILAVQHWGDISKWLQSAWGSVVGFFEGIWSGILKGIHGVIDWFNNLGTGVKVAIGIIVAVLAAPLLPIIAIVLAVQHWGQIVDWLKGVWGGIGKWFADRCNEVIAPFKPIVAVIGAIFQTLWNIIVAIMGKIGGWFHDRFSEAWAAIVAIFTPIGKWFQDRWNEVVKVFSVAGKWFTDRFTDAWQGIVIVFTPIGKWFQDRWKDITTTFANVGSWFRDRFNEAWQSIVTVFTPIGQWFQDKWNGIVNSVIAFKDSVVSKFMDVKNSVLNTFHDFINGIVDKLNDGISAVENFINFFGQGLDGIAKALGTTGTIPVAHLARIPHYADGTDSHPGGPAIVGEEGREMVWLPPGAKVAPNNITEAMLAISGGKIPGYANGIGDLTASIQNWISSGAKTILDNVMSTLHISAPMVMGLADVGSGLLNKVKEWALGWITKLLPSGGSAGPGQAVNVPGNLMSWIMQALGLAGAPANWANAIGTIAMHESGGNPNAINLTDSNAQAGHPSQGIMQTIPSTFAAYAIPGHGNILNPIDNIVAGIRYIMSRYGDVFHVPGIMATANGGAYQGYANGTDFAPGGMGWVGENGPEFMYIPRGAQITPNSQLGKSQTINVTVQGAPVHLDGRMLSNGLLPHLTNAIRYNVGTHRH